MSRERPKTVANCRPGGPAHIRPCPWVTCRYHVLINEIRGNGALVTYRTDADRGPGANADVSKPLPEQLPFAEDKLVDDLVERARSMPVSCVLDLVETCDDRNRKRIGQLFGIGDWAARRAYAEGVEDLADELAAE